jgi:hypothetical protein
MDKSVKKNGISSIQQGRPSKGIASSIGEDLERKILAYRLLYPDWGAKSILNELIEKDGLDPLTLPSIRTIARLLSSKGLTKNHQKLRPLSNQLSSPVKEPHDCWQMDDKGAEIYEGIGFVGMINLKDKVSSTYTHSLAVKLPHSRSHPNISDYQCCLRLGFSEFGLPKAIQADHGTNFYENRTGSAFPTILHLWLIGLGVELIWARTYRPTDQAAVERSHQTTHQQNNRTKPYKNIQELQQHIDYRRKQLNEKIDCDTFGKPPLVAFPNANHSTRQYNCLCEEQIFETNRIDKYLADKQWFRKVSSNHTISIGGHSYYIKEAKPNSELNITFDDQNRQLNFHDDKELIACQSIKGIDFNTIAGENFMFQLKNKQLQIPFDWETIKITTTLWH